MDILVCIKQVPASNKVEVDPVTGVLLRNGADSKMNPYDLYALETALKIREAFAMGVDRGALLSDRRFGGADVLATSYTIAQGIKKMGDFDLILCGKQTTDGDTAQVGSEVSEWLNIPSVSNVKKMDTADREIEVYSLDDMEDKDETHYGLNGSPTQVKRIFPPTANDHHEVWDGDGSEVADKLFHMITDMKFI